MKSTERRAYRGKVRLVVLDWAGTTMDYGSQAPVAAFVEVFRHRGIPISLEQARQPMGLDKRQHIQAICQQAQVVEMWQQAHGHPPTEADIEALYTDFQPTLMERLADFADLIPGTLETIAALRRQGIAIGSSTGYFSQAMELLKSEAARRGYAPDCIVCPDQVRAGRPEPWMVLQNMIELGIYPPAAVVKIDDTVPGIEEGLNAGCWTIGVSQTGNEIGLSLEAIKALPASKLKRMLERARRKLARAGAHFVVGSIAEVPEVISEINRRLRQGEKP